MENRKAGDKYRSGKQHCQRYWKQIKSCGCVFYSSSKMTAVCFQDESVDERLLREEKRELKLKSENIKVVKDVKCRLKLDSNSRFIFPRPI